jgi:MtN3 and saliva related transmembrane protein
MNWSEVFGHLASLLSSVAFVPQVYYTWKTKSVKDLNLSMIIIVFISTIVWLVYGISNFLLPVIICNALICVLSFTLIVFKIKYQKVGLNK